MLRLNLPVLVAIFANLWIGQVLQFSNFPHLSTSELAWLVSSVTCVSLLLTCFAAIVGGSLRSVSAWVLLLAASLIYFVDYYSYIWLAAHLTETVPLLLENLKSFESMRSKMTALTVAIAGLGLSLVAAATLIRYGMRRVAWCARPASLRGLAWPTCLCVALFLVDRVASPRTLALDRYEAKNQVLWHPGFLTPLHGDARQAVFDIATPRFRQMRTEDDAADILSRASPTDIKRPLNIFLFVVDSLRADAIDAEAAPNLLKLKSVALPVQRAQASSNVTHISWFSIAHGLNPLYWSVVAHQSHSRGSYPIRALRQYGYQIRALSCSSLEYFGFETSVFGDGLSLADQVVDQRTIRDPAADTGEGDVDDRIMTRLMTDLDSLSPDGRVFYLVFLDSTHHDYSWAKRYSPRFLPYAETVSVFSPDPGQVVPLKNRYRNAVNFVDGLMGAFMDKLQARRLLDSSAVIVTGDHGEEFLERGHLVHSSELNRFQTEVPLLVYLPAPTLPAERVGVIESASHLDIFPTIFDALGVRDATAALLDGNSLLGAPAAPLQFSAMASSSSPELMMIDGGDYKLHVRLEGARKVGRTIYARRLLATKVVNRNDEEVTPGVGGVQTIEELRETFQPALSRILLEPPPR